MKSRVAIVVTQEDNWTAPVKLKPRTVWAVATPVKDLNTFVPQHAFNAVLEDEMHDWHWKNNKFFYHGSHRTITSPHRPAYLVLEY